MTRWAVGLLAAGLLLVGCAGRTTITLPRADVQDTYFQFHDLYLTIRTSVVMSCKIGLIKDEQCAQAAEADKVLKVLDARMRAAIFADGAPALDPELVREGFQLLLRLATMVVL